MAPGEPSKLLTASINCPIVVTMYSVGASIMGVPCMTSFSISVWLPAPSLRCSAVMGRSSPPSSFQFVILPE